MNSEDTVSRSVAIVHGPGQGNRAAARELDEPFSSAGWLVHVTAASATTVAGCLDLVVGVGVEAITRSFQIAVEHAVPVVIDDQAGREILELVLTDDRSLIQRTSPIGVIYVDDKTTALVFHRAVVSGRDHDETLVCRSVNDSQLSGEHFSHITVDVPEVLPHGPGRDHRRPGPRAVLMTARTISRTEHVLVHPDDRYRVADRHGRDVSVHIDQHTHFRARRLEIAAHPIGVRVLARPDPSNPFESAEPFGDTR